MSKLFNNIANHLIKNDDELYNYHLIDSIDKLIIGSHIKYSIASKIRSGGFLLSIKKSIIKDYNLLVLKNSNGIFDLPFYKFNIYQKPKKKTKSIFESKEIRDKYLNNVSKYLNKNNKILTEDNKMIIKLNNDNIDNNNLIEDNKMIIKLNNNEIDNNLTEDTTNSYIDKNNYLLFLLRNRK